MCSFAGKWQIYMKSAHLSLRGGL
eukprot:COSAG05_NODE_10567_length_558_cov_1.130719_2_plen_23_part_01